MTERMTFRENCRGCGKEVSREVPVTEFAEVPGIRIRCAACRTTNYVKESEPV